MSENIHDLIASDSIDCLPYEIKNKLYHSIFCAAHFFGFTYFIDDLKIKLFIYEKSDFDKKKSELGIIKSDKLIAFMYNVNNIIVIKYDCIKERISLQSYMAIIVHEFIHVLQFYFSKISPGQYVWLYESIACYLAGQKKNRSSLKIETWEVFERDFYSMKDCYEVAYRFGEAIFRLYPKESLNIIKNPEFFKGRLIEMYNSEILGRRQKQWLV